VIQNTHRTHTRISLYVYKLLLFIHICIINCIYILCVCKTTRAHEHAHTLAYTVAHMHARIYSAARSRKKKGRKKCNKKGERRAYSTATMAVPDVCCSTTAKKTILVIIITRRRRRPDSVRPKTLIARIS